MKLSPPTRVSDPGMTGAASRPAAALPAREPPRKRRGFLWRRRFYLLLVVLPTLLAGLYLYGIAAGQYVSEARFVVRGGQEQRSLGGLSDLMNNAGFAATSQDALAVRDYLQSHDALQAMVRSIGLVEIYRRPEADGLAALWSAEPSTEMLQFYHNFMNTISIDSTSGILTIRARAFRPGDSQRVVEEQLALSEAFVNKLSERSRDEALRVARAELERAEQRVLESQAAVTAWRQRERAVDPTRSAQIGLEGMGALEGLLTTTRAELQEKQAYLRPDNPQIQLLRNRIGSLEREIREHRQRLTMGNESLPLLIASYERLALEREFADKQLASATASLEQARVNAQRQQLFVTRVVQPTLAEIALYPRAALILISMFLVLSVLYGIGWMMVSGMREHAF